jgi:hypothetical protein
MGRGHTPFGYRIENGIAVVSEQKAAQIRKLYDRYLNGLSLVAAAAEAGLTLKHTSVKCIMQNPHLLGDDFYPSIIDRGTFDAFEAERKRREKALGRDKRAKKPIGAKPAPTSFRMREALSVNDDPYKQAEYIYSLIESED